MGLLSSRNSAALLKVRTAILNNTFDRDHRAVIRPREYPYLRRDVELHRPQL
jgi:hypothetical protein